MNLEQMQKTIWPDLRDKLSGDEFTNEHARAAARIISDYDEGDDYNMLSESRMAVVIQSAINATAGRD